MKSILTFNLVSLICLIAIACNKEQDIEAKDLLGVWEVPQDSSIVVIYDTDFFLHRKLEGDTYLNYSVADDSIELSQDNIPVFKRRIKLISKDEFLIIDSLVELRFFRLHVHVDSAKLKSLVNWLKQPPIYSKDYFEVHERKFDEMQDLWRSITN